MANCIPMLEGLVVRVGRVMFAGGVVLRVLRGLLAAPPLGLRFDGGGALRFGLNASVVAAAVALLAFAASLVLTPRGLDSVAYYEIVYWGGGHALQFVWTLLMLEIGRASCREKVCRTCRSRWSP